MQAVEICEIATGDRRAVRDFIDYPKRLYRDSPQWVPWFDADMKTIVRREHPFFRHSDGTFFSARRNGEACGRICVVQNARYNAAHGTDTAHFYFFDCADDVEVAGALLGAIRGWARGRKLSAISGPMLFAGATGNGILVDGFEHRAAMTMMNYNYPYYATLLESLGFEKSLDLYSFSIDPALFALPPKVVSVAEKVLARGRFRVLEFRRKPDLVRHADAIAALYNRTLADHPEAYPLTDEELRQVRKDLLTVADPRLVKILTYDGEIVGFLFGFPDLSAAIKRSRGSINPVSILDLLLEFRRTRRLIVNGAGILPEYQRLGGNALLYYELAKTARSGRAFVSADLVQVAETTPLMRSDLETLGAVPFKTHRVYRMALS